MSRITAFRHESNPAQNLVLQFDQIHEKGPLIEGEIQLCKGGKEQDPQTSSGAENQTTATFVPHMDSCVRQQHKESKCKTMSELHTSSIA
jgi:hypothetical protein